MINATVITLDQKECVHFDATPWFEQASARDIRSLYAFGWARCAVAQDIVDWFANSGLRPSISKLVAYACQTVGTAHETWYECAVQPGEAVAWLDQNRPGWKQVPTHGRASASSPKVCRRCGATSAGGLYCPNGCGKV